ncbi:ABC transporter substrate-binding protein [Alsobacter metallidurans]|uniref:ABC transporter substrate-binding protein n=1 Tax=Alsobacter metallidurans TaxID=340221 RepID=A0A917I7R3_9HYPH|nr:ABC transporter substrate-binding protein [Alsobacter metallidurans]GGH22983.1 ABC transporter substrate-binding protein [Alsobacter metallidurans]
MADLLLPHMNRRAFLAGSAALSAGLAAPAILRAQTKELVVGAASSQKTWSEEIMIPAFEKKHGVKVIFEGTRSLVNLEKMQKNKGSQYLSVVQMDDPVMIIAVAEGLLDPITAARVPSSASLKPGVTHMDGMWVNYLQPWVGIAYNKEKVPTAPTSWTEIFDPKYKGRIILPSLQNTEGVLNLFTAAHLKTGKPMADAQLDLDAGFAKMAELKPNVLMSYTQEGQAYNLLEQGEAYMVMGAISSVALARKSKGAPIELAAPREGTFSMPSGIALVKGGPQPELAAAYIDMLLSPEIQQKVAQATFSLPTNGTVAAPAGLADLKIHPVNWAEVSKNRAAWVSRWDRELSL